MKVCVEREKGITLIALVITIIVLLILAGIAIAALSGENGILTRASEAKQKTEREEIIEKAKLEILEEQTEKQRDITDEEAKAIIAKYDKNYKEDEEFQFKIDENNEEYIITNKQYIILVSEIYNIAKKIHFTIFSGYGDDEGVDLVAKQGETWCGWLSQSDNFQHCMSIWSMWNGVDYLLRLAGCDFTYGFDSGAQLNPDAMKPEDSIYGRAGGQSISIVLDDVDCLWGDEIKNRS